MCCCGFCCNANCCCDPFKYAHISAFLCMIEAVFMFCVHSCLILVHTCVLAPPESFGIFEEMWSWFFYDKEYCLSAQGSDYIPPLWIYRNPVPDYFDNTTMANTVSSDANFAYQIVFLILHTVWGLSAIVLIYGNARKLCAYYIPWMVTTCFIMILDIILASFYIALWDQSEPGWEDSQSFFYMITLYLRGYIFLIFNFIQFLNVFHAYRLTYRKRSKQRQREQEIRKELADQSHEMQQQQSQQPHEPTLVQMDIHHHIHSEDADLVVSENNEEFNMGSTASRFRPFSYLSNYRPSNTSDIDNIKRQGGIQDGGIQNSGFDFYEKNNIYPNIDQVNRPTGTAPLAPPPSPPPSY